MTDANERGQIWSIRFSADGKEVVAGAGSGKILVYDIEAQRRSLSVLGHADDGQLTIILCATTALISRSERRLLRRRVIH